MSDLNVKQEVHKSASSGVVSAGKRQVVTRHEMGFRRIACAQSFEMYKYRNFRDGESDTSSDMVQRVDGQSPFIPKCNSLDVSVFIQILFKLPPVLAPMIYAM